jgi:transcriptional regulator with PAS, ATPase and Fis domain
VTKYTVVLGATIVVEADSEEEAIEKAVNENDGYIELWDVYETEEETENTESEEEMENPKSEITKLARKLNVSRTTIRHWIKEGKLDDPEP